ncbi:acriflavin resistance domain-containing protein (plasmid) [Rhizobium etli]|uniref:Acriflavin resistance domain-containing protein n=1 Tax=Rhizobium etli TaxID=29449 RepID=A0AAN1BLE6_RHIET|nr:acriflavin resistance domain-containing protein [Rhizobium etli]
MNFSAFSIRNPIPAILLFVMFGFGELWAFKQLAVQYFPDMDLPTVSVTATHDEAAPTQLETEVARTIKDSLTSLSHLDHILTTIIDGTVSIKVSFKLQKDSETALNEIRNAVDSIKADLPAQMATPKPGDRRRNQAFERVFR